MANLTLKTTITFNAPASKVWQGLTDPALIKQYFFGTNLVTDWVPGNPIYWRGEWDNKTYEDKGTVLEYTDGKFAKYSYWSSMSGTEDKPENYLIVTYVIEENGNETVLTITQANIADEAKKQHSEDSWAQVMNELKKLIE